MRLERAGRKSVATVLILALLASAVVVYALPLNGGGIGSSSIQVTETDDYIEISTELTKPLILKLLSLESDEGVIKDFPIRLYVESEVKGLRNIPLYIYEMGAEGLKPLFEGTVEDGLNEVRFNLPYKLVGYKVYKKDLLIKETVAGGVTVVRGDLGDAWEFIPVYKPVNILFRAFKFHEASSTLYLGSLATPLYPYNASQTLELRLEALCSTPTTPDKVPAPGQNEDTVNWTKFCGAVTPAHVTVKIKVDKYTELNIPCHQRVWRQDHSGQWWDEGWDWIGYTQVSIDETETYECDNAHFAVEARVLYKAVTTEYWEYWHFIVLDEYAVDDDDNRIQPVDWSASGGSFWTSMEYPCKEMLWDAYETNLWNLYEVSLTFTFISIEGRPVPIPVPEFKWKLEEYAVHFTLSVDWNNIPHDKTVEVYKLHDDSKPAFIRATIV